MTNHRDFATVLDAVIAEVPPEELQLLARLDSVRKEIELWPVEIQWVRLGGAVREAFEFTLRGVPVADLVGWRAKMILAWMGAR